MPVAGHALTERLRAAGCVFAEEEAAVIETEVPPAEVEAALVRRERGEPLEWVLGFVEFEGLRLAIEPGVFVPRPRTAHLVDRALAEPAGVALDLCCGCAPVAAALAAAWPRAEIHASDVDPVATAVARRNLPEGVVVHTGSLFAPLPGGLLGRIELIAANVPYVPTPEMNVLPADARDHEPRRALDGGPDGLDVARRVCIEAPRWLCPGGRLLIETGIGDQAEDAAAMFAAAGLAPTVTSSEDLDVAVVAGTWTR